MAPSHPVPSPFSFLVFRETVSISPTKSEPLLAGDRKSGPENPALGPLLTYFPQKERSLELACRRFAAARWAQPEAQRILALQQLRFLPTCQVATQETFRLPTGWKRKIVVSEVLPILGGFKGNQFHWTCVLSKFSHFRVWRASIPLLSQELLETKSVSQVLPICVGFKGTRCRWASLFSRCFPVPGVASQLAGGKEARVSFLAPGSLDSDVFRFKKMKKLGGSQAQPSGSLAFGPFSVS